MPAELQPFITRVVKAQALQLSHENMSAAAALCGEDLIWLKDKKFFSFVLYGNHGKILAQPSMWLVKLETGWVLMTDRNFKAKYEAANDKGERLPPYTYPPNATPGIKVSEFAPAG